MDPQAVPFSQEGGDIVGSLFVPKLQAVPCSQLGGEIFAILMVAAPPPSGWIGIVLNPIASAPDVGSNSGTGIAEVFITNEQIARSIIRLIVNIMDG